MSTNLNLQALLKKIKELLEKGESVKMKNKDIFKLTLVDTEVKLKFNYSFNLL